MTAKMRSHTIKRICVGLGLSALLWTPNVAAAQSDAYRETPAVDAGSVDENAPAATERGAVRVAAGGDAAQGGLPVTGGDVVALTVTGAAFVVLGATLLAARRRRAISSP